MTQIPPVVFVDTETTGLDPDTHEIWEVGLITADGTEYTWTLPVDLGRADPRALAINRYYERMEDGFPSHSRSQFAEEFEQCTRGRHMVGAVISFDEERLRKLLKANGACPGWHYHLVDVEALAAGTLGLAPPWNSEELSIRVGVEPKDFDRHTALGDARWAKAIYEKLIYA